MERDYDGISLLGMRVVVGVLLSHAVLEHFEGFVGVEWGLCGGGSRAFWKVAVGGQGKWVFVYS